MASPSEILARMYSEILLDNQVYLDRYLNNVLNNVSLG